MIKLLADENVPRRLVYLIREQGVDIVRLQDLKARGISDKELILRYPTGWVEPF